MKLSLIIPCYNESANLPLLLERLRTITIYEGIEVVLVDNGSTDETPTLLPKLLFDYSGCRSIRVEKNQGYGLGILSGIKAAFGEILGWTHADMQTDPYDVIKGLELFNTYGPNIFVKGKRYGRPLVDVAFTVGMSLFETVFLQTPMCDINAQPTLFSRDFFGQWHNAPNDFSLDLYAYYQAKKLGLSVHRFPVKISERAHGVSRWNVSWAAKKKFINRTIEYSIQLKRNLI